MQWSMIYLSGLLTFVTGVFFEVLIVAVGISELSNSDDAGRHPSARAGPARSNIPANRRPANDDEIPTHEREEKPLALPRRLIKLAKNLAVSVALVVAFTTLRSLMNGQLAERSPYMPFIVPVALASLFCGPRFGAIVMLSSGAVASYAFVAPQGAWSLADGDLYALILFWLSSSAVVLLGSGLRSTLLDRIACTKRRPF